MSTTPDAVSGLGLQRHTTAIASGLTPRPTAGPVLSADRAERLAAQLRELRNARQQAAHSLRQAS